MADVFISYSADAKSWAEKLYRSLRQEGLEPWMDVHDLKAGERWFDQVERALDEAGSYVFVVGEQSPSGEPQDREWRAALERSWADPEKRIVPVLVGREDAPAFLSEWVPFRLEPGPKAAGSIRRLIDLLKTPGPGRKLASERFRPDKSWRARLRSIEKAARKQKTLAAEISE